MIKGYDWLKGIGKHEIGYRFDRTFLLECMTIIIVEYCLGLYSKSGL